jgi:hypothetical protein
MTPSISLTRTPDAKARAAIEEGLSRHNEEQPAIPIPVASTHYFVATVVSDPDTGELAEQFTRNLLRLPRESILSTWTPDPEVEIAPSSGR